MPLAEILHSAASSDWTTWLVTSTTSPAAEARAFLDRALSHLPTATHNRVAKRLQRGDAAGIDAVLHELVAFETCRTLHLSPTFEPDAGGQRPDLSIQINGTTVWCDVFVTYRPTSTLRTFQDLQGYEDAGQAAKKIGDAVSTKATKYAKLNAPLIVFVMFGRYNVGLQDLETALYGSTVDEVSVDGVSTSECHEDWHKHGILCPPSASAPYPSLSAVVSCDWFDTLSRSAQGRRLHCVVYHHWRSQFPLSPGAFGPFCDLWWQWDESRQRFIPRLSGDSSIVMSTASDDPPRFAPYSTEAPW
jgi:hypothetical protein